MAKQACYENCKFIAMKENEIELPDQAQREAILKMIVEKFALPDDSIQDLKALIEEMHTGCISIAQDDIEELNFIEHIRELYYFHQAFDALKSNEKELTEVRVYLGNEMIAFKQPRTLEMMFKALVVYPFNRPLQEPPKRPRGNSYSGRGALLEYGVFHCIEFVDKFRPDLVQKDKLYFAGLVLSIVGLVETIETYDKAIKEDNPEIGYREKITRQLAYYTNYQDWFFYGPDWWNKLQPHFWRRLNSILRRNKQPE